jgi:AbrB family looped-hinge helix DNA binding protein
LYDFYDLQKEVSKLAKHNQCSKEDLILGSVTVGERGQIVIPAEARKKFDINPGEKLLVIYHPFASGLFLVKIDSLRDHISSFLEEIMGVEMSQDQEGPNGGNHHRTHNDE